MNTPAASSLHEHEVLAGSRATEPLEPPTSNAAEVELARARREFDQSLERATGAGRQLLKQVVVPAACAALVVGGALLFLALRRSSQRSFALVTVTAPPPAARRWRAIATTLAWSFGTRVLLPRLTAKLNSDPASARHPS